MDQPSTRTRRQRINQRPVLSLGGSQQHRNRQGRIHGQKLRPANIQYGITLATSTNHGASFSSAQVDTCLSNPNDSRWFTNGGTTNGKSTFLGDYNGLAIGSDGKAHPAWTDSRVSAFPSPPPGRGHKTQDAVTVSV